MQGWELKMMELTHWLRVSTSDGNMAQLIMLMQIDKGDEL
jgi:hypothetical protein